MKKTLKLFIVLFAVIFLFGAVLFTAMAADGEGGNEILLLSVLLGLLYERM